MPTKAKQMKRYNLALPEELFREIERIADDHGLTVVDVMRAFVKLGLLAEKIGKAEDSAILIKQGNRTRELVLLELAA